MKSGTSREQLAPHGHSAAPVGSTILPGGSGFPSGVTLMNIAKHGQKWSKCGTKREHDMEQIGNTKRPKGFIYRHKPGRVSPFLLFWDDAGASRSKSFETAEDRHEHAVALAERREEYGREAVTFDVREWRTWLAFKAKIGDADPLTVAVEWLAKRNQVEGVTPVSSAIESYRIVKKAEGLSPDTLRQIKKKLSRFADTFGARRIGEIEPEELRAWLAHLATTFAPWTVKDHFKVVAAFFTWAKREKLRNDDPCEAVTTPKVPVEEINILTLSETQKLFSSNRDQPCIGRLALEAFGGLRFSSAGRLVKADLKFDDKGLELPGKKHKSGRRHYIDGLPSNLWEWLKIAPAACWELTERQYERAKIEAFVRAGVTSSQNCLRHSFATYHVAWKKDAALTAILMQHSSPAMLYRHYKGRGTAADGAKYFKIAP